MAKTSKERQNDTESATDVDSQAEYSIEVALTSRSTCRGILFNNLNFSE
jgi:hypothetical protein